MKALRYTAGVILGLLTAGLFEAGVAAPAGGNGTQLVIGAVVALGAAAGMFAWAAASRRRR